jgi:hypothetical protein
MAKIQSDTVVITFNRLVKDSDTTSTSLTPEFVENLEVLAQELAGAGIIVEVQVA